MKTKKESKLIFEIKSSWISIKNNRNYIYFAIFLFLLFLLFAILLPIPAGLTSIINNALKDIVAKTQNLSGIRLIAFIFVNNLIASTMAMLFGIFFCIVSFFIAISNGYILGYVIKRMIEKIGLTDGVLSLWRLFPHGIFELPAVMISLGLGFKLGIDFFQALNSGSFKNFFKEVYSFFKVLIYIIIPLLLLAAIIEGLLISLSS